MNIRNVLQIGIGGAGGRVLDEMMSLDQRYVGLFINSSRVEMENLKNCRPENRFVIPQADGTGRNRELARNYVKQWHHSLIDLISDYEDYDTFVFYFSMDGGFGSGFTPDFIRVVKKTFELLYKKTIKTIAVGIVSEDSVVCSLNNTKSTLEEINKLMTEGRGDEPILNTLYLASNTSRTELTDVNKALANDLNLAFNINKISDSGIIDKSFSNIINTTNGYNLVLRLNSEYKNILEAIKIAEDNSVLLIPHQDIYSSKFITVLMKKNAFEYKEFSRRMEASERILASGINDDEEVDGVIIIGGMNIPSFDELKDAKME